jgi:iron(III)-salmochelin esterase
MRGELGRRELLGLGAALVPRSARSETIAADSGSAAIDTTFETLDLTLQGSSDLSRRALVLVPNGLAPGARVPVLVLLHGLGETTNETAGVHAWVERYGLLTSCARLAHPPITPQGARGDLSSERARSITEQLKVRPFGGRMVFVCPYTPNVWRLSNLNSGLDRFADWIADVLLPTVRMRAPAAQVAAQTGIDGCSLGGFVGLEIFLRKPALFGAWGGVQSALSQGAAVKVADRIVTALKTAGPRRLHIETSERDPFFSANMALSHELEKNSVPHDLAVLPGPHDQPWLREAGTLEMLLWQDRVLA